MKLKPDTDSLAPAEKTTLKPKFTKKSLKTVENALEAADAKAKAKLKVRATNPAGLATTEKWTVKLKP